MSDLIAIKKVMAEDNFHGSHASMEQPLVWTAEDDATWIRYCSAALGQPAAWALESMQYNSMWPKDFAARVGAVASPTEETSEDEDEDSESDPGESNDEQSEDEDEDEPETYTEEPEGEQLEDGVESKEDKGSES